MCVCSFDDEDEETDVVEARLHARGHKGKWHDGNIGDDSSDDGSSNDSNDGPKTLLQHFTHYLTMPLQIIFKLTCPPAGEGQKCEGLYAITFGM